jgi:hypothetical protein
MSSSLAVAARVLGLALMLLSLFAAPAQSSLAPTYYVAPGGADTLSASAQSPGSLAWAVSNAPSGSTVLLEDGTYDNGKSGYTVGVSGVSLKALHWHRARIVNPLGAMLWGGDWATNTHDTFEGMVFGPCVRPVTGGWSGGGGAYSKFVDCEFVQNDGVGFGANSLVLHCLFTDGWSNSFDVASTNFTMRNTIVRRGNRMNGDDDSIGNKEGRAHNLLFDGLIDYDNMGPALWFDGGGDSGNNNWVVRNCTFFANHGGNNWYNLGVDGGTSTTSFYNDSPVPWGSAQDQAGVPIGTHIVAVTGTPANIDHSTVVTGITITKNEGDPTTYKFTFTVSPALPAPPGSGDDFAALQGSPSPGYGLMTEANPNGEFINNVTYNNTDGGLFDADSGDGWGADHRGLTITGNQFDYDGIAFRLMQGGKGDDTRHPGPAIIEDNKFKLGDMSGKNAFHWHDLNPIAGFPGPHYHDNFDHNTYDPDPGYHGAWAVWFVGPGKPGKDKGYIAYSLRDLQNRKTFDQDQHSRVSDVLFRGKTVPTYIWPLPTDSKWSDVYCPNNVYGQSNSIHEVDDDETPYIENAITGKQVGSRVKLKVFGHTAFTGSGPYTCDVYDYSGRFMTITMKSAAAERALDTAVPGYAVLNPSVIAVTITSTEQYNLTANYSVSR